MSFWSDQSDALLNKCVRTFGVTVSYQRGVAAAFSLVAVEGHPSEDDTATYGQGITLEVRVADFAGTAADPAPAKGDKVTVSGILYTVYVVQVDSEGCAKLYLTKT